MYKEILYPEQQANIGLLKVFSRNFYLAGGTAIALQLGHRKSIDFDFFSAEPIQIKKIIQKLSDHHFSISRTLVKNEGEEFTVIIGGTKVTFLYYPFDIPLSKNHRFAGIQLPSIEILGSMKMYTLGRRSKWKDYVDLYTIFQSGYSLTQLSEYAEKFFQGAYNEKLLREQLCYFEDIDYSEEVEYIGDMVSHEAIEGYLIEVSQS
ncbi:nucleotidyl transferase AbiEii/AbiGii toxin family protein [Candidatus Gracilibacteria bacterium]|nr:nucleotidyl transferase AbiEii/AbiGii toxin family protein [Candidatus Gracilibacteria bacterium]